MTDPNGRRGRAFIASQIDGRERDGEIEGRVVTGRGLGPHQREQKHLPGTLARQALERVTIYWVARRASRGKESP